VLVKDSIRAPEFDATTYTAREGRGTHRVGEGQSEKKKKREKEREREREGGGKKRARKSERMSIAGTAPFFKPRLLSI
jgi:hypothetical protein